jgi:hypothetical protein
MMTDLMTFLTRTKVLVTLVLAHKFTKLSKQVIAKQGREI